MRTLTLTLLLASFGSAPLSAQSPRRGNDAGIVPYTAHVPDTVLADLHERLARARFPDEVDDAGWRYGPSVPYLRDLIEYWRDKYDWREQERQLNRFHQFKVNIDGMNIHFIHERSKVPNARAMILLHGWPGSPYELTRVIAPLIDPVSHGGTPEDAFDVVIPSLPGYGFSDRPAEPGWEAARMGRTLAALMARLGYTRYAVQGGDIGSAVGSRIAMSDPDKIIGLHLNYCGGTPPANDPTPAEDLERLKQKRAEYADDLTHGPANRTKAQTIGYGLNDSPVGLAAWMLEKFQRYCDCGGDPQNKWTRDELINWIMMYWLPQTSASAARYYHEMATPPGPIRVEAPTACTVFPKEVLYTPRTHAEVRYNVVRWTEMPRGGHYAAWEQPELLVADIRAFFWSLK